jgi:ABC-2 type transport system permease protein
MLRKFLAIFRREYLERVRDRWFVLATVFGPVLFGVLMFAPALLARRAERSAAADLQQVIVLDATGTRVGRRIAAELAGGAAGNPERARVREVTAADLPRAEAQARRDVIAKRAIGVLVIDAAAFARGEVRYAGLNAAALGDVGYIQRVVREQVLAARIEREGVDPRRSVALARAKVDVRTEQITERGAGASGRVSAIFAIVVATVLYASILLYGQMVLRGVMEEKQTRVAEVVLSSVPASTLLAGKVLGVAAVGLTQLALWSAVSFGMYRARQPVLARLGVAADPVVLPSVDPTTAALLLLYFLLGYLFFAALFAIVGAVVNSEQEAQQAQTPVILLLVSSVAVLQPVLTNPDGGLARVMSVLPFSAPIVMPLRMSLAPVSGLALASSLLTIAAGAHVAVWLAARIYRVGLLMYGKQPSVREILRWTRTTA